MKTIDQYILKEWLVLFFGCLIFLISFLCIFSIAEDITNVFPKETDSIFIDLVHWSWPYLPWLLPISALFSSLFLTGFLKKSGEWTAIQSVGISTVWCFRSVLFFGLIISYTSWLVSSSAIGDDHSIYAKSHGLKPLTMKIGKDRMWYFSSFDESKMEGHNVQLFHYDKAGRDVFRVWAEKASWFPEQGWTFYKGKFLGFRTKKGIPAPNKDGCGINWKPSSLFELGEVFKDSKSPLLRKEFDVFKDIGFNDNPSLHMLLGEKPKKLSFNQLNFLLQEYPNKETIFLNPHRLRRAQLIWSGPAFLIALLGGLTLGTSRLSTSLGKLGGLTIFAALLFYVVRTLSDSLAEVGIISPTLGASVPYLSALLAIFLLARLRS